MSEGIPSKPYEDPITPYINRLTRGFSAAEDTQGSMLGLTASYTEVVPLPEEDVATIKREVLEWLDLYYELLRDESAASGEGFLADPSVRIGILDVLIQRAGSMKDTAQLDRCMATLDKLTDSGGLSREAARLQTKAMLCGSTAAHAGLQKTLSHEQERLREEGIRTDATLADIRPTYLAEVIGVLSQEDLPVGQWIDTYAVDPIDRLGYYVQARREGSPTSARVSELENAISDAYLFLPDNVAVSIYTPQLIESVREENRRHAMFNRFARASRAEGERGHGGVDSNRYKELLDALTSTPPSALSAEHRSYIRRFGLRAITNFLRPVGFASWTVDAYVAMTMSPEWVIDHARKQAGFDRRMGSDQQEDVILEVVHELDTTFGKYARRHAAVGDFEATQAFLQAMTSPHRVSEAIVDCMQYANTPEQRVCIRMDELREFIHPEIAVNWRMAEAMAVRDNHKLETAIRDLVDLSIASYAGSANKTAADDHSNERREASLLGRAFSCMEPERALALAQELRETLHTTSSRDEDGGGLKNMQRQVSETLLRLGDPTEIKQRFASMRQAGHKSVRGLQECTQLATSFFSKTAL